MSRSITFYWLIALTGVEFVGHPSAAWSSDFVQYALFTAVIVICMTVAAWRGSKWVENAK